MPDLYLALTAAVLTLHVLFILWVAFGAFWTRRRPWLTALHLGSLAWGVVIEVGPWPCPLTSLEQALERASGQAAYRGAFLLHYLRAFVYPDLSDSLLIAAAVAVCALNLLVYARRWRRRPVLAR